MKRNIFFVCLGVALGVVIGILVSSWPWRSLSGEIQDAIGRKGTLYVEAVSVFNDYDVDFKDIEEDSSLTEELGRMTVKVIQRDADFPKDSGSYLILVREKEGGSGLGVCVTPDGKIHIGTKRTTYQGDTKLYELVRKAYEQAGEASASKGGNDEN